MKKWEYETVYWDSAISSIEDSDDFDQMLNEYGSDGWEVVSMTHQVDSSATSDTNGVSSVETYSMLSFLKENIKKFNQSKRCSKLSVFLFLCWRWWCMRYG
ncbi:DUF4177 domain-containing protein [Lysinibacillus sp.]|uniref:DUF4177 domain-containing protein n=1 Tax=Lysinibacillus sp. TaxID=1869345 RepID=UPI0028969120|nr:DUF4177 domain-containing protein [Lysinibacillus sp.]